MNRIIALFLSVLIAISPILHAAQPDAHTHIQIAVQHYNKAETMGNLLRSLMFVANEKDQSFLESLLQQYDNMPLPMAHLAKGEVSFAGVQGSLNVRKLSKGIFSFRGKDVDLRPYPSLEKQYRLIEKIYTSNPYSWFSLVLPKAEAALIVLGVLLGVYAFSSFANAIGCIVPGGYSFEWCKGSDIFPVKAFYGPFAWFLSGDKPTKLPDMVYCKKEPNGTFLTATDGSTLLTKDKNGKYDALDALGGSLSSEYRRELATICDDTPQAKQKLTELNKRLRQLSATQSASQNSDRDNSPQSGTMK